MHSQSTRKDARTQGRKLQPSAALERFAKEFPKCVAGLQIPTATPDHLEPMLQAHPNLNILSAADRCLNWPSALIVELCAKQDYSGMPATSQEVNMHSQASDDSEGMPDFENRFYKDTQALQRQKEENWDVKNALMPLAKELLIAVENAPCLLEDTCVALLELIANLNVNDDDEMNGSPTGSIVLPTSKKSKTRQSQGWEHSFWTRREKLCLLKSRMLVITNDRVYFINEVK
jgi:hypothetical protein